MAKDNGVADWQKRNIIWTALYRQGYDIRVEYKIPGVSTRIDDYQDKPYFKSLKRIYDFLLKHDKSKNAQKTGRIGNSGTLPDCDVVLHCSNQVIEIDEKHHFNWMRHEVLGMYPDDLPLAFDREQYRHKCGNRKTGAKASSVWFEVIRDFLPWIAGINPTARIDISFLPSAPIQLKSEYIIDFLKKCDHKIEFYKNRKGGISSARDNDNVDEEKNLIYRYLLDKYEIVYWGYPPHLTADIEDYQEIADVHADLTQIHLSIENYRGKSIESSKQLAACDIFIPEENRLIELDEIRHFTALRAVALSHYPHHFKTAYDRDEYVLFCKQVDAKDHDPPNRDEQRAWYDTIRDFIPLIDSGYRPIIRLPLFRKRNSTLQLDREALIKRVEDGLRLR